MQLASQMQNSGKILFGVLNWGLGHATRSAILIKKLAESSWEPIIASDGEALLYLKNQFPQYSFLELPSYHIAYSKHSNQLGIVFRQLPAIYGAVSKEKEIVRVFIRENPSVKGVISDNRLGFYHPGVPSVYITHQLNLQAGWLNGLASRSHRFFIHRFSECWVPDFEDPLKSLAGKLSKGSDIQIPLKYLGPLSRFSETGVIPVKKKYLYSAVLSGPEPQRSILERKVVDFFSDSKEPCVLVRGTKKATVLNAGTNVKVIDMAGTEELYDVITSSKLLISRSGYSSIMDYYYLQAKALLIPTPGQTEQEYLAQRLRDKKLFYSSDQKKLNFAEDLKKAMSYSGFRSFESKITSWEELFSLFEGKRKC